MFVWILFIFGILIGVLLAYLMIREAVATTYEAKLERWKIEREKEI